MRRISPALLQDEARGDDKADAISTAEGGTAREQGCGEVNIFVSVERVRNISPGHVEARLSDEGETSAGKGVDEAGGAPSIGSVTGKVAPSSRARGREAETFVGADTEDKVMPDAMPRVRRHKIYASRLRASVCAHMLA